MRTRSRAIRDEIIAKAREAHSDDFIAGYALVVINAAGEVSIQMDSGVNTAASVCRMASDALGAVAVRETLTEIRHTDREVD